MGLRFSRRDADPDELRQLLEHNFTLVSIVSPFHGFDDLMERNKANKIHNRTVKSARHV